MKTPQKMENLLERIWLNLFEKKDHIREVDKNQPYGSP